MSQSPQPSVGPSFVLTTDGELFGADTPENRALVRRIHACFAAFDGLSTEELEQGVVAEMRRLIGQVVPLLQSRADAAHSVYAPAEPMSAGPRLRKAA